MSVAHAQTHRLPWHSVWGILFLTAAGVAVANFCIVYSAWFLVEARNHMAKAALRRWGFWPSAWLWALACAGFALPAAMLVVLVAPIAAGGGLPEMKGYLNGSKVPGLFSPRVFVVRFLGTILSVAAGFPVGREGPTISVGCHIGFGAVQLLGLPYVQRWVNIDASDAGMLPALLIDEERHRFAKRIGCAVGGAAGMATIFNAPIGGLLYMLEEVTVTSWAPELTLQAFITTVLACLGNRALLNLCGQSVYAFLIFADGSQQPLWEWGDLFYIIVLAASLGAVSALYSKAMAAVFRFRRRVYEGILSRFQRRVEIAEATVYALVCALVFMVLTSLTTCRPKISCLEGVQALCPDGHFNSVATLLFSGPEEGLKVLYMRCNSMQLHVADLMFALVTYIVLNIGMAGLAMPMGLFIPNMFVGAMAGRIFGHMIHTLPGRPAPPGFYALIGSAAMLAGSLRQTMSIVVFLMECMNDLDTISPLMVAVFVSHVISRNLSEYGMDEHVMQVKGVPHLESEVPEALDCANLTAGDLCRRLSPSARLPPCASVGEARRALAESDLPVFPVVENGTCLGLISRQHLEGVVRAKCCFLRLSSRTPPSSESESSGEAALGCCHGSASRVQAHFGVPLEKYIAELCAPTKWMPGPDLVGPSADEHIESALLPLLRVMDPAPYILLESTPALRAYPLFARLGATAAVIMSRSGELEGVLTRTDVIRASQDPSGRRGPCARAPASPAAAATAAPAALQPDPDPEQGGPGSGAGVEVSFEGIRSAGARLAAS